MFIPGRQKNFSKLFLNCLNLVQFCLSISHATINESWKYYIAGIFVLETILHFCLHFWLNSFIFESQIIVSLKFLLRLNNTKLNINQAVFTPVIQYLSNLIERLQALQQYQNLV